MDTLAYRHARARTAAIDATTTTAARTHPLDPESSGGLPPTLSGDQSGALAHAGREAKEAIER